MIERVEGRPRLGDQVTILQKNRVIGNGLFNPESEIRVRIYSRKNESLDSEFFKRAIKTAIAKRDSDANACRLIFSEADYLSGLTVDRYGAYLVMQVTSGVIYSRLDEISAALVELLSPKGIFLKSSGSLAKKEGIPNEERVLYGAIPDGAIEIEDNGILFEVDLRSGQKTGFYLDQRENRPLVGDLAKGGSVLDLYCYSGGFALHAARRGAKEVIGVDSSEGAIALAKRNAIRNQLSNVSFIEKDALAYLQSIGDRRFSMIILDPPKLAMSRETKKNALKLYYRLNEAAIHQLEPEGILVTCSCSGRVSRKEWKGLITSVARRERRAFEIIDYRRASRDHPVVHKIPETNYLKCLILRVY